MPKNEQIIINVILAVTLLILILSAAVVSFVYAYSKKHTKYLAEKEEMQFKFQQELLRAQLEIQEQTFKTISQEIHDNIGQMLSLAKLNLNRIDINSDTKNREKICDAKELVSKSIHSLRDLSKTLNMETVTSIGLLNALEIELTLLRKADAVRTNLNIIGTSLQLDARKELILFRICQEALNNIIKHASATYIQVTAIINEGLFELVIYDNGCGFSRTSLNNEGSGLRNMKSRAEIIGAKWEITSNPGTGTKIHISLPIID